MKKDAEEGRMQKEKQGQTEEEVKENDLDDDGIGEESVWANCEENGEGR